MYVSLRLPTGICTVVSSYIVEIRNDSAVGGCCPTEGGYEYQVKISCDLLHRPSSGSLGKTRRGQHFSFIYGWYRRGSWVVVFSHFYAGFTTSSFYVRCLPSPSDLRKVAETKLLPMLVDPQQLQRVWHDLFERDPSIPSLRLPFTT